MSRTLLTIICGIAVLCLASPFVLAQDNYQFTHLTSEDGLLDDMAYSVFQDSKGFYWFGTVAGLQRYDGQEFVNYTHEPRKENSALKESIVRQIAEMADGTLWVATQGGGISRIKDGNVLSPLRAGDEGQGLSSDLTEDMVEDTKRNGVWIATQNGLNFYDHASGEVKHYVTELADPETFSLAMDPEHNLWIGSKNGLTRLSVEGQFTTYTNDPTRQESIAGNFIHDIIVDRMGNIWLAIVGAGVDKFHVNRGVFTHYSENAERPFKLSNNVALGLAEDLEGNIWVGTWGGGLQKIEPGGVTVFRHDESISTSILTDNIEELMVDRNGNVWTANFLGGINRLSEVPIKSYVYRNLMNEGMLPTAGLRSVIEASDGSIWFNSYEGVNQFIDNEFTAYTYNAQREGDRRHLSASRPFDVFEDSKGRIWVGNLSTGADYIENGQITHFVHDPNDPDAIPGTQVCTIEEGPDGKIWMGFVTDGLASYDEGKFTHYVNNPSNPNSLGSNRIRDISFDREGGLWIATTESGINYYDGSTFHKYKHDPSDPNSLPKNSLNTILEGADGDIWVGYVGGLARLDRSSGNFRVYDQFDGLPGMYIEDLDLDARGNLWVATHSGGALYHADQDRFEALGKKEGLTNLKLTSVHADEWVYFGGQGGFYQVREAALDQVHSSHLFAFSEIRFPEGINPEVDQDLARGLSIELPYDQNTFEVFFSAMNGDIRSKTNIYYRIEGLQESWVFLSQQNSIPFTYLKPGDYEIQVRDGRSEPTDYSSLLITINPPWWRTVWFQAIIFTIVLSCIIAFILWRRKLRLQLENNLRDQIADATDEIKLQRDEISSQKENLQRALEETNQMIHEALESGNLNASIDTEGKEGLWLDLTVSINLFFENLTGPIKEINQIFGGIAEGDLSSRFKGDVHGDLAVLVQNLNNSLEALSSFLGEIRQSANRIKSSADEMLETSTQANLSTDEITSAIGEISKGAMNQVDIIDQSSQLLETVLGISQGVAGQAVGIRSTAEDSNLLSTEGLSLMGRMDNSMHEIEGFSQDTGEAMKVLEQRTSAVAQILNVMQEIASQTNLLALNAAIEAAQAGDAGRGFAVVAGEIRQLSDRSKKSVREIEELVSGIQEQTEATSDKLNQMGASITKGVSATKSSHESFRKLAKANDQTLQMSKEIEVAAADQTSSIQEIVQMVESVVVIAEETAAGTTELSASSQQLSQVMKVYLDNAKSFSDIAIELGEGVDRFKLTAEEN